MKIKDAMNARRHCQELPHHWTSLSQCQAVLRDMMYLQILFPNNPKTPRGIHGATVICGILTKSHHNEQAPPSLRLSLAGAWRRKAATTTAIFKHSELMTTWPRVTHWTGIQTSRRGIADTDQILLLLYLTTNIRTAPRMALPPAMTRRISPHCQPRTNRPASSPCSAGLMISLLTVCYVLFTFMYCPELSSLILFSHNLRISSF